LKTMHNLVKNTPDSTCIGLHPGDRKHHNVGK
jgi:hypothetical protein